VPIQATREYVPPQSHAAFATTEKTRITVARILGGAREASHQAIVSMFESASDVGIPHS
jgi:hypothetical protein